MLSFEETKNRLKALPFDYKGQGKNKTLKLQDPELFEAIYYWSQPLESKMKECGRYASSYNFSHRVMFILDKDGNIENMKCIDLFGSLAIEDYYNTDFSLSG